MIAFIYFEFSHFCFFLCGDFSWFIVSSFTVVRKIERWRQRLAQSKKVDSLMINHTNWRFSLTMPPPKFTCLFFSSPTLFFYPPPPFYRCLLKKKKKNSYFFFSSFVIPFSFSLSYSCLLLNLFLTPSIFSCLPACLSVLSCAHIL